ncbi:MAG: chromosomal replication initiator protein DnaA [Clostridia bacterium]|nr:chromosomal replication initiator protein DnaA [Clostridia bacterium]
MDEKNNMPEAMENLAEIDALMHGFWRETLSPTVFKLWFQDLILQDMNEESAVFSINNDFKRDILQNKHVAVIKLALEHVCGFPMEVFILSSENNKQEDIPQSFYVHRGSSYTDEEKAEKTERTRSEIEGNAIISRYTFENFIIGESNKFAQAACYAVATSYSSSLQRKGEQGSDDSFIYNPLFIYGPSGIGKTHLLYAITNEIKKSNSNVKIVYKTCEDFTNEMVSALKNANMPAFREKYRSADIFLIDDVQFLAHKEAIQDEFFHTFSTLYENEKQIILTSDRPPKDIKPLVERLRTRFEWGLIADIQPPSAELRAAIIRKKAEGYNLSMTQTSIDYLSENLNKNIRQIEGAMKKLSALAAIRAQQPDLDMCRHVVGDMVSGEEPVPLTIERIVRIVSEYYDISAEDIKGKKRSANIVAARHMCIYLIRELTTLSLQDIGEYFDRDHTTVIYSIEKIENEMADNKSTESLIKELIEKIKD